MARKKKPVLPEDFLDEIYEEAYNHFHTRRALSGLGRSGRPPRLSVIDLAHTYALWVESAVGAFADLLTQALIARRGALSSRTHLRIVEESLRLASLLEEVAFDTLAVERLRIPPSKKIQFTAEVTGFAHQWTSEAQRRIKLRCLLMLGGLRLRKLHESGPKAMIGILKEKYPNISQETICCKLDDANDHGRGRGIPFPVPDSWFMVSNQRTWTGNLSHRETRGLVKAYISKIEPLPPLRPKRRFPL